MTLYLIDSNILIAEILSKFKTDGETKTTLSFYRKIPLMRRIVTDFILTEFELYILHSFPKQFLLNLSEINQLNNIVSDYLRQIHNNTTFLAPNHTIVKSAFSLYSQFNSLNISNRISYTDSLLLSMAIKLQYTIISLDKTLLKCAEELKIPYYKYDKL